MSSLKKHTKNNLKKSTNVFVNHTMLTQMKKLRLFVSAILYIQSQL